MTKVLELIYPAKIVPDGQSFIITFRDLKNVFSEGDTYEAALINGQEALNILLQDMAEDGLPIPDPSPLQAGEIKVPVSPEVAVPVLLHKLREQRHYSMTDVARCMGVSYQSYQQIEHGKNVTLKTLKKAAAALGAVIEVKLYAADL